MKNSAALPPTLTADDYRFVRALPLFASVSEADMRAVVRACCALSLPNRHVLYHEGEQAGDFFVLVRGWVKLYRLSEHGVETVINVYGEGQSFAETVALAGARYMGSAETLSEARVVRVPAVSITESILSSPAMALAMVASAAGHMHALVNEISSLKARSGAERVVGFLRSLGAPDADLHITLPFEKQTLARYLGMQPESLSRTFRQLKAHGIVVSNGRVRLPDRQVLDALMQEKSNPI